MNTYSKWEIKETKLKGVYSIIPNVFKDHRGSYIEIYNKEFYDQNNVKINFIQDDVSISKKGVLRGVHGDNKTHKLITCLHGELQLIVVNNDEKSDDFKKWISFDMSSQNIKHILVPPKFGNGHLVTSDFAIFHYKQNTQYDRESQFTIKWNDTSYGFGWKNNNPILSTRDK